MVTFPELVGLGLGSASLFGLIVGVFSVYNGRATRRLIIEEERRTQGFLERMQGFLEAIKDTQEAIKGMQGDIKKTQEAIKDTQGGIRQILEKNTAILERLAMR